MTIAPDIDDDPQVRVATLPPPRPRKPCVYIAGPIRHKSAYQREKNIRVAESALVDVLRMGAACICVHSMCRYLEHELPDQVYLDQDLELLLRSDALFLVDGWERSVGSRGERDFAEANRIPIFTSLDVLKQWIEQRLRGAA